MKDLFEFRQDGFTLIEVLVSLVILSTGIVLVLGSLETLVAALGEAQYASRSTFLATQRMAELDFAHGQGLQLDQARGIFQAPFDAYAWLVTESEGSFAGTRNLLIEVQRTESDRVGFALGTVIYERSAH